MLLGVNSYIAFNTNQFRVQSNVDIVNMIKKLKKIFVFLVVAGFLVFNFTMVKAADTGVTDYGLGATTGEMAKDPNAIAASKYVDPATQVGTIIGYLLSFVGLIFLILVIYGGFEWMVAGGDEAKVTKAKDIFTQAVFGLIFIAAAYLLVNFVSQVILNPTTGALPS
jgi:hypothetical protein